MSGSDPADWTQALADTLLPEDVNAGRPTRLDCDDAAVAEAARVLGIPRARATAALVSCLKEKGLISGDLGVRALVTQTAGNPPPYLVGLALLVLAASRMASDQRGSMREYYVRLADVLEIPMRENWPHISGVPELVDRFDDLAGWMEGDENGRRGLLDLPQGVYPAKVGVPINQSLIRTGDRITLGAFFERTSRLIDAGWDPIHQLEQWGGRHHLTVPLLDLLEHRGLHAALAGALRAARRSWDGSTIDADGRRLLPGRLGLHLPPGPFALSVSVPALEATVDTAGPGGSAIRLDPISPAEVPLAWLAEAENGPLMVDADNERVRVLPGPTVLFEVTDLGVWSVAAASTDPVWVLTCDPDLIESCVKTSRYRAQLPPGWELLSDIEPELLAESLRTARADDEERPLNGVNAVGGLRLSPEVWLVDHPPDIVGDLPEPAPIALDGRDRGYIEPQELLSLEEIASVAGVHRVDVGEQELSIELVERGPREGIGSLGFDLDQRRVHGGVGELSDNVQPRLSGPLITPAPPQGELPMTVRYRCTVDVIDVDGTTRRFGPPTPAAWLEHVGLPNSGPWGISEPSRVVWLCVDAARGKFVVAQQAIDVPLSDDALDVAEWYEKAQIVDRTGGGASGRWERLIGALEAIE